MFPVNLMLKFLRTSVSGPMNHCRWSSWHQTTGVQLISKHHYPQTRDHLSGDPSFTHPCFYFSLLTEEALVKQIRHTRSGWSFPHLICTCQPARHTLMSGQVPSKVLCMNPWAISAEWRNFCFPHASGARPCWTPNCSASKTISQSQPQDHIDLLDLHFCSFANQKYLLWHQMLLLVHNLY